VALIEIIGLVLIGVATGSVAAALGVGGGVIFVPALVVLFSFDQHLAQGTSLAVILPTAIVSTIGHARLGRVIWPLAIPLAIAGIIGGFVGARTALLLDGELLRRLFAVLLIILGLRMAMRTRQLFLARGTRKTETD